MLITLFCMTVKIFDLKFLLKKETACKGSFRHIIVSKEFMSHRILRKLEMNPTQVGFMLFYFAVNTLTATGDALSARQPDKT